jgi:hypothetical protein
MMFRPRLPQARRLRVNGVINLLVVQQPWC